MPGKDNPKVRFSLTEISAFIFSLLFIIKLDTL